jgi:hypothetical protein
MELIVTGVVGVVAGAVIAQAMPKVMESTTSVLRSAAREVIKGGLVVQDSVMSMCSESGNVFSDLVAEARAEMAAASAASGTPAKIGAK